MTARAIQAGKRHVGVRTQAKRIDSIGLIRRNREDKEEEEREAS